MQDTQIPAQEFPFLLPAPGKTKRIIRHERRAFTSLTLLTALLILVLGSLLGGCTATRPRAPRTEHTPAGENTAQRELRMEKDYAHPLGR